MARITQTFTANTTWTVPTKCYLLEVFLVGGGGGGGSGGSAGGGGGGGGGRVLLTRNFQVTPGQNISVIVGNGGAVGAAGGTTSFASLSAAGGGAGGSNGGAGGSSSRTILGVTSNFTGASPAGGGASANESATSKNGAGGYLFGSTLYAPGGGGGINPFNFSTVRPILPGVGGETGGGRGSGEDSVGATNDSPATQGVPNTGAGGGGGAASGETTSYTNTQGEPNPGATIIPAPATPGAAGGSGIVIISYDEAEFELVTDKPGVQEGQTITLTLNTRNVWNGASLSYTISGTNITAADFSPATLSGTLTVTSANGGLSGSSSAVITVSADALTESDVEVASVALNNGLAVTSFQIGDFSKSDLTNIESKTISKVDYNTIQSKIAFILGPSPATNFSNYGWGQTVLSSQVAEGTTVGATEWNNLRNDLINAWVHLYNASPSLTFATENNIVRGNISTAPYAQYDSYANVITANRFGINPNQSRVVSKATADGVWPGAYGSTWNSRIYSVINVSWNSAKEAREFFNTGGEIRFNSTRTGGSVSNQNSAWTSLLSSVGTQALGGDKPLRGNSGTDAKNFYRLTNTSTIWYQASSTTPYSNNVYRISARTPGIADNNTGTANSIEFLIEWVDSYATSGGAADAVDGTFSLSVTTLEAVGSLVPNGTFTISSPTVTVSVSPRP